MMIGPVGCHIDGEKTASLLITRRIHEHLRFTCGNDLGTVNALVSSLTSIQQAIYAIDCYGEEVWEIDEVVLRGLWNKVHEQLAFAGVSSEEAEIASRLIVAYQDVEVGMRYGRDPRAIPLNEFYNLKTCDVQMARRIIAGTNMNRYNETLAGLWRVFDVASEVCDDLTDVDEDRLTFNCNRYVLEILHCGSAHASNDYVQMLNALAHESEILARRMSNDIDGVRLHRWAIERIDQARRLLATSPSVRFD